MALFAFLFDWSGRSGRAAFAACALAFWGALAWLSGAWALGAYDAAMPGVHWPLLAVGATLLPYHAGFARRLNDAGLPARLYVASLVPLLGLIAVWIVATRRPIRVYEPVRSLGRRLAVIAATLVAVLVGASAFLALHRVPGVDMKPALLPGDVLIVARWAGQGPAPGDIAVFRHPVTGETLARRVLAGPGQRVAVRDGRPVVDGDAVAQEEAGTFDEIARPEGPRQREPYCANGPVGQGGLCRKRARIEELANGRRYVVLDTRDGPLDTMAPVTVPAGHVFVLGDNRDNAIDSRVSAQARGVGPVPSGAIIGRAGRVLVSPAGRSVAEVWRWRPGRVMVPVE